MSEGHRESCQVSALKTVSVELLELPEDETVTQNLIQKPKLNLLAS